MATERWNLDAAHSGVHFTVRHMVFSKVRGAFTRFGGTLELDEQVLAASSVSVQIEAASIDTREAQRDAHLRSADFFDVEKYPELRFQSTKVEKSGEKRLRITGELTIHGVTREVVLDAQYLGKGKDPWGNPRVAFTASTSVDRKDYGLRWNQLLEAGGVLVGEKIEIELEVQAIPAAVAAPVA
jgi:polyisoprenoid-binding protein YceI